MSGTVDWFVVWWKSGEYLSLPQPSCPCPLSSSTWQMVPPSPIWEVTGVRISHVYCLARPSSPRPPKKKNKRLPKYISLIVKLLRWFYLIIKKKLNKFWDFKFCHIFSCPEQWAGLEVELLVRWLVGLSVGDACEKVTFRVSKGY